MIISVGYRVKSHIATRFRQWAAQHIKEFIVSCHLALCFSWFMSIMARERYMVF
jgi:hypothetical protein